VTELIKIVLLLVLSVSSVTCSKENEDKVYDATLTFYSMHSPFVIKYTDDGVWHIDTIVGNNYVKPIKARESDFAYSQQIKSVAAYSVDSLFIRAYVDGRTASRGFKGLYMQIEIDVSLSQAQ